MISELAAVEKKEERVVIRTRDETTLPARSHLSSPRPAAQVEAPRIVDVVIVIPRAAVDERPEKNA